MDAFIKMNKVTALLTGAWLFPALLMVLIPAIKLGYVPHAETHVAPSTLSLFSLLIVEVALLISLLLVFPWAVVTIYLFFKEKSAILFHWVYNLLALFGVLSYWLVFTYNNPLADVMNWIIG